MSLPESKLNDANETSLLLGNIPGFERIQNEMRCMYCKKPGGNGFLVTRISYV